MILEISAQGVMTLHDPQDLKRFKVSVNRPESDFTHVARLELAGMRFEDVRTAWVATERIVVLSGLTQDAAWSSAFQSMLAFCSTKGWLSESGGEVRAHVEWNA